MSYTYLKVFEKQVPLNNKYEDVVAFWKVHNGNKFLNNLDKHSFFSSYDSNYNNLNHYILLNFPLQDGLTTSVTLTREQVGSEFDSLLNKNYVHVVLDNNNIKDLYYFITNINYSKGRKLVNLSLELDVFSSFSEHLDLTKRPILAIRNSVNRFSNLNGCNEMLYTDDIDSKFSASILNDKKEIFNGDVSNLWAVVYCSSNAPILKAKNPSRDDKILIVKDKTTNEIGLAYGRFEDNSTNSNNYEFFNYLDDYITIDNTTKSTRVKSINNPYKVFVIPLTSKQITIKQDVPLYTHTSDTSMSFNKMISANVNINYGYDISQFFNFIQNNEYVYKVQVTTFDFLNYLANKYGNGIIDLTTLLNNSFIFATNVKSENNNNLESLFKDNITKSNGQTLTYKQIKYIKSFYCNFLIGIKDFDEIVKKYSINCIDLFNMCHPLNEEELFQGSLRESIIYEYGTRGNDSYQPKSIYLEPKLYCNPYTRYTYTSSAEPEYDFNPYLTGRGHETCEFELSFTPTPSASGETMFITSGIYEYAKANYNGTSPISSLELSTTSQALQEFLTTQRNSYYTGLAQSYFNNAMSMVGDTAGLITNIATKQYDQLPKNVVNIASDIGDVYYIGEQNKSKLKDLANVPSKFNNLGFDILPIINNTNLSKYINCYVSLKNEYEQAYDYFYYYGYKTNEFRKAYKIVSSNSIMTYVYSSVEKNIFNRALFNYIRIGNNVDESIELNTNYDLDFIQKDKINEILHKGVRIWTPIKTSDFLNFNFENMEADLIV